MAARGASFGSVVLCLGVWSAVSVQRSAESPVDENFVVRGNETEGDREREKERRTDRQKRHETDTRTENVQFIESSLE